MCEHENIEEESLIDSGAGGKFIDQNFARTLGFKWTKLDVPIEARNVDGTLNKRGTITHTVTIPIHIGKRTRKITFKITGLGTLKIILGFNWLQEENPIIDWKKAMVKFPERKVRITEIPTPIAINSVLWTIGDIFMFKPKKVMELTLEYLEETLHPIDYTLLSNDNDTHLIAYLNEQPPENEVNIAMLMGTTEQDNGIEIRRFSPAVQFASQTAEEETKTLEERIPKEFHRFLKVFSDQAADRVPEHKPWDHKIELKPGFEPRSSKIYPLNPMQELETKKFIDEHLISSLEKYLAPFSLSSRSDTNGNG